MAKNSEFILIDTGFFVAIFSSSDRFHKKALQCRSEIANRRWITTWPVLTETSHMLSDKFPSAVEGIFSAIEQDSLSIFDLRSEHMPKLKALTKKYRQLPMDLADASLVILAEELNCGDIVSTDQRDFTTYRFKQHKPFRNLLV
jgi:predicted nucleic acid-binding protein